MNTMMDDEVGHFLVLCIKYNSVWSLELYWRDGGLIKEFFLR